MEKIRLQVDTTKMFEVPSENSRRLDYSHDWEEMELSGNEIKDLHPLNIQLIFFTLFVLNLGISKFFKALQFWNIKDKSSAFSGEKLDKSKLLKEEQFWNIEFICLTLFDVNIFDKFNTFIIKQFWNI